MYDGGLVGSTASVEGSIASADQSSLCPSPTTATSGSYYTVGILYNNVNK